MQLPNKLTLNRAGRTALLLTLAFSLGSRSGKPTPLEVEKSGSPAQTSNTPNIQPGKNLKSETLRTLSSNRDEPAENIRFGPLTREHFAKYEQWIEGTPRRNYFIQLLATDANHTGEIEGFLARATETLDPAELRAYRSNLSGRDRVGVIYGDFSSRETAAVAMQALPESIKAAQPFPRQVSKLR